MKQMALFQLEKIKNEFGGELLNGKRKSRRPISTKHPLHLVLRADISQSGSLTHYKRRGLIERLIHIYKKKYGVKVYRLAVVANHIHLLVKVDRRESYAAFVRVLTGVMAKRLHVKWLWRPFTRIVQWGRAFTHAAQYVIQNQMEAAGVVKYKARLSRHQTSNQASMTVRRFRFRQHDQSSTVNRLASRAMRHLLSCPF